LKPFPLGIELHISVERNISVTMGVTYLTQLKLACVDIKDLVVSDVRESEFSDRKTLFHHLLVFGDTGERLPHVAAAFLRKHSRTLTIEDYGHPYQWVHDLCGIKNLPGEPHASALAPSDSNQHLVEKVVKAVKKRILSQISLVKQLQKLATHSLQPDVGDEHLFPPKMHSQIQKWQELSGVSLQSTLLDFPSAILFDAKEPTNKFYHAIFGLQGGNHVNINLHCLVCVSNMYPSVPPFVALKVELNSNRQVHNIQLKEMEQEVNINFHHLVQDDSDGQGLLLRQLLKVQMCFDVYLSCCGVIPEGPLPKAMLPIKFKGPTKSYPFKYSCETGTFYH
jgi:hypothetical protein